MSQYPDCSICSKNYTRSLGLMCKECSSRTVGTIVVVAIIVACAAISFAVFLHLLYGGREDAEMDLVDRVAQSVPVQAVKIIVAAWQILTQVIQICCEKRCTLLASNFGRP